MNRTSLTASVALIAALGGARAFADGAVGPETTRSEASVAEDHIEDHEIHRGRQLHWLGAGLAVAGAGLALASVPLWRAVDGCTECAPQSKLVGGMAALGLDGFALVAIAGGVASWVIGTSRIDRARARREQVRAVVPLVVPVQGGAVTGAVIVF